MIGRVDMARGFVASKGAVLFVSDAMAAGGEKFALDPLSLDIILELHDAVAEGFILVGREVGASATAAAAVVLPSSRGKGIFKLRENFFDCVVSVGGGLGDLNESPLDDLVSVSGGGGKVVKVGVKVLGYFFALGETRSFDAE